MNSYGDGVSVPSHVHKSTSQRAQTAIEAFGRAKARQAQRLADPAGPDGPQGLSEDVGGAAATSLVLLKKNGESELAPPEPPAKCDRVHFDLVNVRTGMRVPGRCNTYGCLDCGPWRLQQLELALTLPLPERFVTLTWAPEDHEQRRAQVRDLTRRLRGAGYRWEFAWSTEVNPKGTGHHIHGLQMGSYVPQAVLQDMWGGRIAHIKALKFNTSMAAAYVVKEGLNSIRAAGYTMKHQEGMSRPVHITRGYFKEWGGLTQARQAVNYLVHGVPMKQKPQHTGPSDWRVDHRRQSRQSVFLSDEWQQEVERRDAERIAE